MNHINVVLQSLYNACPLREAVFEKSVHQDTLELSAAFNSLQLIFAKMHYDMENRGEATQASIYFKDDYLRTAPTTVDPNHFYTWITGNLAEISDKYRKLLQWELFDVKRTVETGSEVVMEEQFNILPVDFTSQSLQSYLDELFQRKREEITVTLDGEGLKRTIETFKELSSSPTIATFLINPRTSEEELKIEESVFLHGDKEYKLNSVIIYDPQEMKYSTCLRDAKHSWYRLEDDSFTPVSLESVLISASKFAVMLFYIESRSMDNSSPKPSQQLIVESLTKDTMHNISKTIQRQTSNSPPSKPLLSLPSKSKNMSLRGNSAVFLYGDSSPSTLRSTSTPLSLPTLPLTKTPPPDEFLTQLESILVPADLSRVKMNLITTETQQVLSSTEASSKLVTKATKDDKREEAKPRASSFDEVGLFATTKKELSDDDDLELDYFEEVNQQQRPKPKSIWSQHYLPSEDSHEKLVEKGRAELFSGLLDFEIDFHDTPHAKSFDDQEHFKANFETEEEADLLLQASLAQVRKTREEGGDLSSTKKHTKKSAKIQKAQSIISSGLFYRSKAVLPFATSSDQLANDEATNFTDESQQKQKKKHNRYTKF